MLDFYEKLILSLNNFLVCISVFQEKDALSFIFN